MTATSQTKHTPGPWVTDNEGDVRTDGGDFIASVYGEETSVEEANALLIAAAPDLLAALREVMGWVDNWSPQFIYDDEWTATEGRVRAALAKAGA